ncbi:MAG: PKD domain-containing protein [Petrotogales bacterium]
MIVKKPLAVAFILLFISLAIIPSTEPTGTLSSPSSSYLIEPDKPPIAEFTWTPPVPEPYVPVIFNASDSYDPDGYIALYEWDWDGDGKFDENHTGATITHFWEDVGDFPVTLRVTDNTSLTGVKTKYVRVRIGPFEPPAIYGPTSGKVGVKYDYSFVQTNPHGDEISYFIDWGDNTTIGWTDYFGAGEEIIKNHTWYQKGDYIIKAKVKDIYGRESYWGTLEVKMPKKKLFDFNLLGWSLEQSFMYFLSLSTTTNPNPLSI